MVKLNSCGLVSFWYSLDSEFPSSSYPFSQFCYLIFCFLKLPFQFHYFLSCLTSKKLVLKIHPLPVQVAYSIVYLFLWLSNFFLQLLNLILNLFKITDMHVITILYTTAYRFSACTFTAFRNTTCIVFSAAII